MMAQNDQQPAEKQNIGSLLSSKNYPVTYF